MENIENKNVAVDTVENTNSKEASLHPEKIKADGIDFFGEAKSFSRGICNTPPNKTQPNFTDLKFVCGVDSLYYFIEPNSFYMELFHKLKIEFDSKDYIMEYNRKNKKKFPIFIDILGENFYYQRREDGFIFFTHYEELYTIGFKSVDINKGLLSIRVELLAIGIYTLGLKPIINMIDRKFRNYITLNKQITRLDLNCFVNSDFSMFHKENFITKKQKFDEKIAIRGKQYETETFTIGSKNHKLRLYNKLRELEVKGGDKEPIMLNYFEMKGLNIDEPIWNIEFEIHREFLKSRDILTVDDALKNATMLFQYSMRAVRLVDIETSKDMQNKQRIETNKIWEYIHDHYTIDDFIQNSSKLLPQRKVIKPFLEERAKEEQFRLFKRREENNLPLDHNLILEYLNEYLEQQTIPTPEELLKRIEDEYKI